MSSDSSTARYLDASDGRDWPGYGRTFGQQHYSPLSAVGDNNVDRLGLAWSIDLPMANTATQPIAVDGILYFATGLSVIHAVDAQTGKELWTYDPLVAEKAELNLRLGWGVRGVSWWDGKIYTGTQDGRLIAVDAKTGKPVWSVQTFDKDYPAHINGAPRVFAGKVVIGYASTTGATRGFVTAYDAGTGKQLWRFYTTPGDPAKGFENDAMKMAAKTWAGEWWKFGGGADVWNAIAYDPELDTVFIGTGSGYPWNRRVRSADQGDNLFVASIVALDGKSGAYKWHYQVTPGDTWDYDATMDIEVADLVIDGKPRKVIMQAPKNGFFYVIDRVTGKPISAQPYAKVTWASGIDPITGRPVENPGVRYPGGASIELSPSGAGAHSWMPMAFSPQSKLVYIPAVDFSQTYTDSGVDLKAWRPPSDRSVGGALGFKREDTGEGAPQTDHSAKGRLLAWDPVAQKRVWEAPYPTYLNSGLLATGGGLVFQGSVDGIFRAYAAQTGKLKWSFAAQAPILGTPISYQAGGRQYITVLTGIGMGIATWAANFSKGIEQFGLDPRTQARRVLTFAIDGKATLPGRSPIPPAAADPSFSPEPAAAQAGMGLYFQHCGNCHGGNVVAVTHAPDLRRSPIPTQRDTFADVVRRGLLVPGGMPAFAELSDEELESLRTYIRTEMARLRASERASRAANRRISG